MGSSNGKTRAKHYDTKKHEMQVICVIPASTAGFCVARRAAPTDSGEF